MLGAFLRAAGVVAAGLLLASVLKAVLNPILDVIGNELGTNAQLYVMLADVRDNFIIVILLMAVMLVVVRAVVESRAGGKL